MWCSVRAVDVIGESSPFCFTNETFVRVLWAIAIPAHLVVLVAVLRRLPALIYPPATSVAVLVASAQKRGSAEAAAAQKRGSAEITPAGTPLAGSPGGTPNLSPRRASAITPQLNKRRSANYSNGEKYSGPNRTNNAPRIRLAISVACASTGFLATGIMRAAYPADQIIGVHWPVTIIFYFGATVSFLGSHYAGWILIAATKGARSMEVQVETKLNWIFYSFIISLAINFATFSLLFIAIVRPQSQVELSISFYTILGLNMMFVNLVIHGHFALQLGEMIKESNNAVSGGKHAPSRARLLGLAENLISFGRTSRVRGVRFCVICLLVGLVPQVRALSGYILAVGSVGIAIRQFLIYSVFIAVQKESNPIDRPERSNPTPEISKTAAAPASPSGRYPQHRSSILQLPSQAMQQILLPPSAPPPAAQQQQLPPPVQPLAPATQEQPATTDAPKMLTMPISQQV